MDVVIPYFTPQTLKPSPAFNLFLIGIDIFLKSHILVLFITAYRMGAMFHLLHYILLTFSRIHSLNHPPFSGYLSYVYKKYFPQECWLLHLDYREGLRKSRSIRSPSFFIHR